MKDTIMHREAGFTLLELMIVVIIIGILSAIAIPSYHRYVVRAHRTDAQRTLLDLAGRQERYFYSHNTYADALGGLGGSSSMAGNNYTILPPSATSTDYTITAQAVGAQAQQDAECQSLSVDRAGSQTSAGTATASVCWGK
jgi:type IV pilus assembly protein PilE